MQYMIAMMLVLGVVLPVQAGQKGIASRYSTREGSSKTASGTPLNDGLLTAAHRTLPFGSKVRVTNLSTGKAVQVTITDRGPFVKSRIIDLSMAAARAIGLSGLAKVELN